MRTGACLLATVVTLARFQPILAGDHSPPSVTREDAPARPDAGLEVDGNSVRHSIWGVQIQIPGYEPWADHPMSHQPNFILAASSSGGCGLNLSTFVELTKEGATAEECRRRYLGNPEPLLKRRDVRLHENEISPITYTLYDHVLSTQRTGGTVQNQLYGYWTRGDHCFELHVSSMNCERFAAEAIPILNSVKIFEETGATLETVTLAMQQGGDPRDWKMHLAFASHYLHRANPKNPGRARRFYTSALRLGGGGIPGKEAWIIEEGIGLSWLMQDDGRRALPHLERALAAAAAMEDPGNLTGESIYNLACAHALVGDLEATCSRLRSLLSPLRGDALQEQLKEIRKDDQLKPIRKADCYKTLLEELGIK